MGEMDGGGGGEFDGEGDREGVRAGEKAALKHSLSALRSVHARLADAHAQLQARHARLLDEKVVVETEARRTCDTLRAELANVRGRETSGADQAKSLHQAENDAAEAQEALSATRRKCTQLQQKHAQVNEHARTRTHVSQQELHVARLQAGQATARSDALSTSLQQKDARHERELEAMRADYKAALVEAEERVRVEEQKRLEEVGGREYATGADDRSRALALEKDLAAATRRMACLEQEVADIRRDKDDAVSTAYASAAEAEARARNADITAAAHLRQIDTLTGKVSHLERELVKAADACDGLHAALAAAARDRAAAVASVEERAKLADAEKAASEARRRAAEREAGELQAECVRLAASADSRLEESEGRAREILEGNARDMQRKILDVKDRADEIRVALDRDLLETRMRLEHEAEGRAQAERRHADETEQLQRELEAVRKEAAGVRAEGKGVSNAVERERAEANEARRRAEGLAEEVSVLQSEYRHLQEKHREVLAAKTELVHAKQAHDTSVSALRAELSNARLALDRTRADNAAAADAAKRAWAVERSVLARRAAEAVRSAEGQAARDREAAERKAHRASKEVAALAAERALLLARVADLESETRTLQARLSYTFSLGTGVGGEAAKQPVQMDSSAAEEVRAELRDIWRRQERMLRGEGASAAAGGGGVPAGA
eukprot:jgi/Chlat1/8448/Chrsp80S07853